MRFCPVRKRYVIGIWGHEAVSSAVGRGYWAAWLSGPLVAARTAR